MMPADALALCVVRSSPDSSHDIDYSKISNIRHNKSQNFNDSRLVLQLFLPNPLKPDVKSRMKM